MSLSQPSYHGFTKSLLVLIYTRSKPALLPQFMNTKEPVVFIYHRGEVTRFWLCRVRNNIYLNPQSPPYPFPVGKQFSSVPPSPPPPPSLAGDKKMSDPLFVYPIMPLCRYKRSKLH